MSTVAPSFVVRQEQDRLPARRLTVVVAASILLVLLAIGWAAWLLARSPYPGTLRLSRSGTRPPEGPREVGPIEQTQLEATAVGWDSSRMKRRELDSYGWENPDLGTVRIPITRAMDLVVRDEARPTAAKGEP